MKKKNQPKEKTLLQAVLAAKAIIVQNWKSLAQLNLAHWYSILSELAGIGKPVFLINNKPNIFSIPPDSFLGNLQIQYLC